MLIARSLRIALGAVPFTVQGNGKDWQGYQVIFPVSCVRPRRRWRPRPRERTGGSATCGTQYIVAAAWALSTN